MESLGTVSLSTPRLIGGGVGEVEWGIGVGMEWGRWSGWRLWALSWPTMGLKNLVELLGLAPEQLVGLRDWWHLFVY